MTVFIGELTTAEIKLAQEQVARIEEWQRENELYITQLAINPGLPEAIFDAARAGEKRQWLNDRWRIWKEELDRLAPPL